MEVINDLVGYDNLKIYQDDKWFRFSLESILLPNFVKVNLRDKNIIDLCTGNAPIPLVLSTRTKASVYGVEIQQEIYDLAVKTVKINDLEERIKLINDDIKNLSKYFEREIFDLVTVNPPYFKYQEQSIVNDDVHKQIARHEVNLTFDEIVKVAYYLLKNNGRLTFVHRTERLIELLDILKNNGFKPKRLQFIYPNLESPSKLFMMEVSKGGRDGLLLLPPLYVHNDDGTYRQEILKMFKRGD